MSARVPLLEVSGLVVRYGAVTAVRGVDLTIGEGEIVSIVGPNGAGKTSLVSAVAGIVPPAAGSIVFAGKSLAGIALEDVVAQGIALVPEGRHIFASLTVTENLMLGATVRRRCRRRARRPRSLVRRCSRSSARAGGSRPDSFPAANSSNSPSRARSSRGRGS